MANVSKTEIYKTIARRTSLSIHHICGEHNINLQFNSYHHEWQYRKPTWQWSLLISWRWRIYVWLIAIVLRRYYILYTLDNGMWLRLMISLHSVRGNDRHILWDLSWKQLNFAIRSPGVDTNRVNVCFRELHMENTIALILINVKTLFPILRFFVTVNLQ